MAEIIPAIVPKKFVDLEEQTSLVYGTAECIQIDICDGKFTTDLSWPFLGDTGEFAKIVNKEKALPNVENLDYEIHLMTDTPADEVADWAKAGAMRILAPIEAGSDTVTDIINEWGSVVEIGLVANMETPVEIFESYLEKVKTIQLMSIGVIGHQGEPFDNRVLEKIKRLREIGYQHKISVDGGINLSNTKGLIEAGANRLVVNSAIFGSKSPIEMIKLLQQSMSKIDKNKKRNNRKVK